MVSIFQEKVDYIIDVDSSLPPLENAGQFFYIKSYDKYMDDHRTAREIMLTFI